MSFRYFSWLYEKKQNKIIWENSKALLIVTLSRNMKKNNQEYLSISSSNINLVRSSGTSALKKSITIFDQYLCYQE